MLILPKGGEHILINPQHIGVATQPQLDIPQIYVCNNSRRAIFTSLLGDVDFADHEFRASLEQYRPACLHFVRTPVP